MNPTFNRRFKNKNQGAANPPCILTILGNQDEKPPIKHLS